MKENLICTANVSSISIFDILEDTSVISENTLGFTKSETISGGYSTLKLKDNGLKIQSIQATYSYTDITNGLGLNFFNPSPTFTADFSKLIGVIDEWADITRGFHVLSDAGDIIYKSQINFISIIKNYLVPVSQKDFYLFIGRFQTYPYKPIYCKDLKIQYTK